MAELRRTRHHAPQHNA
jgi:hypothetical protein